jgi:hypothetical protein
MIIAHLTRDLDTLKACSLTCHSWYIVAAAQLHHTLTLKREGPTFTRNTRTPSSTHGELKPLASLHELGLVPLVKAIRVEQWRTAGIWFVPQAFDDRDLRYFSAFAKVHTLRIQKLDINHFIPVVERYFGHFSPTLRSIMLDEPHSTPRQLSHFLSLFSNLDDIEIRQIDVSVPKMTIPDTELVPFSAPKLRGRLELHDFIWVKTWTDLIATCGGLRFRHIDLRRSGSCAPVLLKACAETLETLRFTVKGGSVRKWFCVGLSPDSS